MIPYISLDVPIRAANAIGPARSPIVLLMPSSCSANAEAHWLTACSEAPAHNIIIIIMKNIFLLNNWRRLNPVSPFLCKEYIGADAKRQAFIIGTIDHIRVSIFQFTIPNNAKKTEETITTSIQPQQ